jgi:type IV pilus assembly protein PilY1
LANIPLYSGGGSVRPNLLLDLSVEFPTVKAAYNNASDYNKTVEYLGYFNSKKCYTNGGVKSFTLVNTSGTATGGSKTASWSNTQPAVANAANSFSKFLETQTVIMSVMEVRSAVIL